MKCPHCNYEDSTLTNDGYIAGYDGNFFRLPVKLEQPSAWGDRDRTAELFACPSCDKTFIERN